MIPNNLELALSAIITQQTKVIDIITRQRDTLMNSTNELTDRAVGIAKILDATIKERDQQIELNKKLTAEKKELADNIKDNTGLVKTLVMDIFKARNMLRDARQAICTDCDPCSTEHFLNCVIADMGGNNAEQADTSNFR